MSGLFEIVGEFQQLYDMAIDTDIDPQIFEDTLESLMGELEVKSAGYVAVINQLTMEMDRAGELEKKFKAIKEARTNSIKAMKDRLLMAMDAAGTKEIPAGDFTIKVQGNGGKQPLKITGDVPEQFTKITIENDSDKIRDFLKDHECEWAHLEPRGRHINIK